MRKLISLIVLSLFLGSNAIAEGFKVGLSGNIQGFYGVGTETVDNGSNSGTVKTSEAGAFDHEDISIFVEYDMGPMSVGIEYHPDDIETPENVNVRHTSATDSTALRNTVKADFEDLTTLYAIIDIPFAGMYLKAGYVQADIETRESLATGSKYPNVDTSGFTAGFGFEHAIDSLFVRLEATASQYDDVSASSTSSESEQTTAHKVDIDDMMSAHAKISIGYAF